MRLVLAAIALAGCAGQFSNSLESEDVDAPEEERPFGSVHGIEREHVEYEVRLRGMVVGRVQIAVGTRGVVDGRPSVIVVSRASGAGLADALGTFSWELTSTVDIDSGCVVDEKEDISAEVFGARHELHRGRKLSPSPCHRNIHAGGGALRGWRSRPGAHVSFDVDIDDVTTIDVSLTDAARETIRTVLGSTPTIRYDGMFRNKYAVSAWLSDDDARLPLRMRSGSKLGQVEMDLVSYDVKD